MADVAIPSNELEVTEADVTPETKPERAPRWSPWLLVSWLASLRPTVFLFALAFLLVFVGTLAQKYAVIWTVVNTYLRTPYVWVPLQVFFPCAITFPGGLPFP